MNRKNSAYAVFALCALAIVSLVMYSHSVTPAVPPSTAPPLQAKKTPSAAAVGSIDSAAQIDSTLLTPPAKWVGKKFVVLDKPRLFRKFGYELYLTKDLSTSVRHIDTSLEVDRHHLRYDLGRGTVLKVTAIEPVADEWLIGFSQEPGGRVLYGKTHKAAIEGLACCDDLDKAAKMWTGKTVYSRRRFINTYDSAGGTFGTIKVNVQDRLVVTAVRWGTTPLPPKPLWLCVSTADRQSGFIPTTQTWTNVMTDKISGPVPWSDDIFEKNPMEIYSWDSTTWKAINTHTIVSGMNKEQVRVSWGPPHNIIKDTSSARHCPEEWRYGSQYLCFDHDTVVTVGGR
jgi:hypothetical protein